MDVLSQMLPLVVAIGLFALAAGIVSFVASRWMQRSMAQAGSDGVPAMYAGEILPPVTSDAPSAPKKQALLLRVGGRVIDPADWPADVIETVKKEYFLPPAIPKTYLARVDLTGTCPKRHATMERVGIVAATPAVARSMVDGIPRARAQIVCGECGKTATVTGKSIAWEGPFAQWDGAT